MKVKCINTKNVGLLPWVVCESGMTCYVDGGSSTLSSTQLCRWWIVNVIVNRVMSMVDRQLVITVLLFRRKTLVKVKLWTAGMWFLVRCQTDEHCTSTSFLFQMKHFHQDSFIARGADYCCFSYRSWNVFIIRPSSFYSTTWSMKRWWVVFISPDELFYVSTSV